MTNIASKVRTVQSRAFHSCKMVVKLHLCAVADFAFTRRTSTISWVSLKCLNPAPEAVSYHNDSTHTARPHDAYCLYEQAMTRALIPTGSPSRRPRRLTSPSSDLASAMAVPRDRRTVLRARAAVVAEDAMRMSRAARLPSEATTTTAAGTPTTELGKIGIRTV